MKKHQRKTPAVLDIQSRLAIKVAIAELGQTTERFPPFETWEELERARSECGLGLADAAAEGASLKLAIALDCVRAFEVYLCGLLPPIFANLMGGEGAKRQPKLAASLTLLSGMATDVGAIAHLVCGGYDIQAKVLVRSLREKLDALVAVQLDRAFAVAFIENQDADAANHFWHSRVARGRLMKNIAKKLAHYSDRGDSVIDEAWIERRRRFDRWLGMAVHPSHTTGLLTLFPGFAKDGEEGDAIGFLGCPSDNSIPTLRAVMDHFTETMIVVRNRQHNVSPEWIAQSEQGPFLAHCHDCFEKFLARCTVEMYIARNAEM